MDSSVNNEIEYVKIILKVKKNSPLIKPLEDLKNDLDKILSPDLTGKTYGKDKLTIDQMTSCKKDALAKGHSHFFNGKICRNGHVVPRTIRGECNQCVRDAATRSLKKRKERLNKNTKK